jgi:hypothetical protein
MLGLLCSFLLCLCRLSRLWVFLGGPLCFPVWGPRWWQPALLCWSCVFLFIIWCLYVWWSVFAGWPPRLPVCCCLWRVSRLCRRSLWGSVFCYGVWCTILLFFGVFVLEWVCFCKTCNCLCWMRLMWWYQLVPPALCSRTLGWVPCSLCYECDVVLEGLVLLNLLRCICSGCIFWGESMVLCMCVVVWLFLGCSWCVGWWLGMACVSSLGELVLLRSVACLCVRVQYRWPVLVLLWVCWVKILGVRG